MTKHLTTAIKAYETASKIALKYWRKKIKIRTKSNWRDLVTIADIECDKAIRSIIQQKFPSHDILSEEKKGKQKTNNEWLWVIDPLDGTSNYTMGEPIFGVSIGLSHNLQPFMGVVGFPALQEIYWAEKWQGAWREQNFGNKKIEKQQCLVSTNKQIKYSHFSLGFTSTDVSRKKVMKPIRPLLMKTRGMRINYCATFDFMNVARGGMDFYINLDIHPWDFAASWPIIQEAGGELINSKGKSATINTIDIIATNSIITSELLKILK